VADHEHAGVVTVRAQQRDRVVTVEAAADRLLDDGLDPQRAAGQLGGVERADLRARVTGVELQPEPGERRARGERLSFAAGRQLSLLIESCGTASPCRSSQSWGAIAPRRLAARA